MGEVLRARSHCASAAVAPPAAGPSRCSLMPSCVSNTSIDLNSSLLAGVRRVRNRRLSSKARAGELATRGLGSPATQRTRHPRAQGPAPARRLPRHSQPSTQCAPQPHPKFPLPKPPQPPTSVGMRARARRPAPASAAARSSSCNAWGGEGSGRRVGAAAAGSSGKHPGTAAATHLCGRGQGAQALDDLEKHGGAVAQRLGEDLRRRGGG